MLPATQEANWVGAITLPEFKRTDSAIRRPAVLAVVQGVTVNEKRELPAISTHGHEAMIDLAPRLNGPCVMMRLPSATSVSILQTSRAVRGEVVFKSF